MVFQVLSQSKSGKPLIQSIVGQQWKNPQKVLRKLLQNVSSKATFCLTKKALLQKVQESLIGDISLQRNQILLDVTCIMLHSSVSLITMGQYLVQRSSLERPLNVKI